MNGEFNQLLYTHYDLQDLCWECKASFVINWFSLNILRMNGQNLTKVCILINIEKIYVGIVTPSVFQTELCP